MNESLDSRMERALDNAPEVVVPHDFAARLVASLPEKLVVSRVKYTYARRLALACAVLLAAGLMWMLAGGGQSLSATEMVLATELGAITLWLSYRRTV